MRKEREKKLMVFDLDGTLNQTENYALPAMRESLDELGFVQVSNEKILKSFGASDEDTNVEFFGDQAEKYAKRFWKLVSEYVEEKYVNRFNTFPNTIEMLEELKKKGWTLAICSNAESEDYLIRTARRLKISHLIEYYQSLCGWKDKNYSLQNLLNMVSPDVAVMVGDRFYDKDAAKFNNIPFAACVYGYGEKEEFEGADYLLEDPLDLLQCEEVL